jgi:hypothetical protein
MIDTYTFGNSLCAINLANILITYNNKGLIRNISTILTKFSKTSNRLLKNPMLGKTTIEYLFNLSVADTKHKINNNQTILSYPLVKSHLLSLLDIRIKKFRKNLIELKNNG